LTIIKQVFDPTDKIFESLRSVPMKDSYDKWMPRNRNDTTEILNDNEWNWTDYAMRKGSIKVIDIMIERLKPSRPESLFICMSRNTLDMDWLKELREKISVKLENYEIIEWSLERSYITPILYLQQT
jgi:hypothetical protein